MEKLMLQEVVQAVGGRLLQNPSSGADNSFSDANNAASDAGNTSASAYDVSTDTEILSVVTDSRKITPGCVFFALAGDRFDGHAYVQAALEKGAAGCVVMREPQEYLPGKFYILVPDTRRALGDLAHYYRMKFDVCVVGITGSVGKTTCREMVETVLSRHFKVHATAGNFNNDIGLPMTIFGLSGEHQVLVLEMGMNHPGEISRLSQIAAPDIAVITNIGTAHIGNLGSRENIFLAKKEIFDGMKSGAKAVLCGDDDFLPRIARDPSLLARYHIFFAGKSGICSYRVRDAHVEIREAGGNGDVSGVPDFYRSGHDASMTTVCRLRMPDRTGGIGKEMELRIPAVGMHLVYPASIAAAVGDLLGMSFEEIREGIADFAGQRMACEQYGDILLFDDTYNASPDSMKSSLQVLACLPAARKAAVLGDMLEQGEYAEDLHREVGAAAAEAGIDTLLTIGPLSVSMAEEARRCGLEDVREFPDRDSAAAAVEEITQPGTALLFKASHGLALDRLAAVSRRKAESILAER
ncbi:MAG: UDP-N-acetylmuramoyl-tripeptide--D-alanyl-D-alanine ligase [Lachnospiraceae bacterium]|nr:UDP-N-acetylmuramoyl-tripeptide--D-alanyl-D-alanine ligase [Lachnospiraceae bacterium]